MPKISVAINVILLLAISYLYYYNFWGSKNKTAVTNGYAQTKNYDSSQNSMNIAYVELDSLNKNLIYLKQLRKDLELQQKRMEAEITNDLKRLETKQNSFVQKNPAATPEQIQNFRIQMQKGQDSLDAKKQSMSQLMNQKRFELMENIQKNLKEFLIEYNKEKKYKFILTTGSGIDYLIYKDSSLDITDDVIKGMNEKMKPVAKK